MSRIGRKTVAIPSGVTIDLKDSDVTVKGPKGEMKITLLPEVTIKIDGDTLTVDRINDERKARARHGLTRQLIANMVEGVSKGFEKRLEIIGVGYRASANGKSVDLSLGFSHPVKYMPIEGVEVHNDAENKQVLVVSGISKEKVGQVAADIRAYRPPEPYKGKGVRYVGEYVPRKVGKAAGKGDK